MSNLHNGERVCPNCGWRTQRVQRLFADRLISLFVPVMRYRCQSATCGWEGRVRDDGRTRADAHRNGDYVPRHRLGAAGSAPPAPRASAAAPARPHAASPATRQPAGRAIDAPTQS